MDTDGDGKLSREELLQEYAKTMPVPDAVARVEHIMEEVDADNSGFIDYSEFVMAATRREALLERENLEAAFRIFDSDGSGKINASELREVLHDRINNEEEIWDELIELADQDGDREIDIREFKEMMFGMF